MESPTDRRIYWTIRDLGSSGRTYINAAPIPPNSDIRKSAPFRTIFGLLDKCFFAELNDRELISLGQSLNREQARDQKRCFLYQVHAPTDWGELGGGNHVDSDEETDDGGGGMSDETASPADSPPPPGGAGAAQPDVEEEEPSKPQNLPDVVKTIKKEEETLASPESSPSSEEVAEGFRLEPSSPSVKVEEIVLLDSSPEAAERPAKTKPVPSTSKSSPESKHAASTSKTGNGGGGRYGAGCGLRTSPESSGDENETTFSSSKVKGEERERESAESVRKGMVNSGGGGRALKQLTFKTTDDDDDTAAADERPSSASGHYSNSRTGRPAYRSSSNDSDRGSQSPPFRNSAKRKASASNEAGGRRQRKKSKGEADVKIPKIALVRLEPPKGASSALISEDGKSILRWMRWTFHKKRTPQDALNEPLSRVEGGVEINVKDEISSKRSAIQKKRKLFELSDGDSSSPLVSSNAEELSLEEGEIRKTKNEKPKRRKKRTKRNIVKSFEASSSSEDVEENQPTTSSAKEALNFSQVEEVIEVGASRI